MTQKFPASLCLLAGALLSACAVSPLAPLPATSPASSQARETPMAPPPGRLVSDAATKKSQALLDAAEKGTSPSSEMSNMPGMNMGGTTHADH